MRTEHKEITIVERLNKRNEHIKMSEQELIDEIFKNERRMVSAD